MGSEVIVELQRNSINWANVVGEIVKIERKIFPKHESLARSFDEELRKKNSGLLYTELNGEVAGYAMYSWPSSLCASITKLAGFNTHYFFLPLSSLFSGCIFLFSLFNKPITCLMKVLKEAWFPFLWIEWLIRQNPLKSIQYNFFFLLSDWLGLDFLHGCFSL